MLAFSATTQIAKPIGPIRQLFFALASFSFKKPMWEFNFIDISVILLSIKHRKMLSKPLKTFLSFQSLRFLLCSAPCNLNETFMYKKSKDLFWSTLLSGASEYREHCRRLVQKIIKTAIYTIKKNRSNKTDTYIKQVKNSF